MGTSSLREIAPDVWVAEHELRAGSPILTRMTVVRRPAGDLVIHAPVPLGDALCAAVDALGPVRWLLVPNRFHGGYAGEWTSAYPEARLHVPPSLASSRAWDLLSAVGSMLPAHRDPAARAVPEGAACEPIDAAPWMSDLEVLPLDGLRGMDEYAFFHPPSRTLLVTDLFFNYPRARTMVGRVMTAIEDCDGKFCVPRMVRLATDKLAFGRSAEALLAWDFDRVVMAHSQVLASGGREAALTALAWARR